MEDKREKTTKIKCSFCDREIECPENMLHYEKHACFECYKKIGHEIPKENLGKIHVDVPKNEMLKTEEFLDAMIGKGFEQFMSQSKSELKAASKKEAMKESFFAGASFMLQFIDNASEERHEHEHDENCSHEEHEHEEKEHIEHKH